MNEETEIPSIDPANDGDLVGAFRHIFGKMIQNVDDMLPAQVIAYDRVSNRATVQPLVMVLTTGDTTVQRASVASIPVFRFGGGDFMLSFNLKAGDLGWIKANDRDISLFLQSGNASAPNTLRKHSFSDAMFYPDAMRGYTVAGEDLENAVLQNKDGSVKISVGQDKIKIVAPAIEMVSGSLTHNGVNIGSTHTHGNVSSGTSNTGVPN